MVSEEDVMEKLEEIEDPDTKIDIVNMGFIYDVEVNGGEVDIEMTLTSPGCPMHKVFVDKVEKGVSELEGVESVEVDMVFNPPWSPERMSDEAKEELGME
ncbi:MAG: metal-sulfur cluster assembly factor [Candidatus Aenigmatarchaeota archaeon]